jgi:hypothetical protein
VRLQLATRSAIAINCCCACRSPFPVSRNAAVVSHARARSATLTGTDDIVAHVNMRTLQMMDGLVFRAHDDLLLMRRAGDVRQGTTLDGLDHPRMTRNGSSSR